MAKVTTEVYQPRLIDEICEPRPCAHRQGVPFFGPLSKSPVKLDGPRNVEGQGVTHLYYSVIKA